MRRGLLVLLFLLLCSLPVFAAFDEVSLNVGGSKDIKGVNFTLMRTNVDDDKVVLCVNNQKFIVDNEGNFGNAAVRVNDVFDRAANLEIEVTCETKCNCNEDCNNAACFVSLAKVQCNVNAECNDNDANTNDLCVGGICENRPKQLKGCTSDSECDDKNPCTSDDCNSIVKKCVYEVIQNCSPSEQDAIPSNTTSGGNEQKPSSTSMKMPIMQLSTFLLFGLVILLLIALVVKRAIK
jgi:hypothetical protein